MTKIVRSGQSGALDHLDSSQATFRSQIAALTDAVRQLGGNAQLGAGATVNDPLNAPYVLYVNPSTGDDTFAGGEYSSGGTADDRISLQRLECGYTQARPFKTINRAVIEAGILTAKSYYVSPLASNDLVSIVLMPGVYTIYNAPGKPAVAEWPVSKNPTDVELTEFNPQNTGGVVLPRGVSLCGLDLRKTIFRPDSVPAVADEAADSSNRRAIFKVTGSGYYFGFTFMDKVGSKASHHLLHAFEFASKPELDEFYGKIAAAFGGPANTGGLDLALAATQTAEYEIVGPQPASGSQTEATDTTLSASPYIFNCSLRSNHGMCGVYADGAKTSGFRSMVIAQFTGVSLQRDLSCWQKYDPGKSPIWDTANFANYADYISTPPDNVRMAAARRSFHIKAINNAVIQEVSVFAIGQGVHHWTTTGGEITITNSNSNFGACAAISEGYRAAANAADKGWTVGRIRVADNLSGKANSVQRIYLGTVSAVTGSTITLVDALGESQVIAGTPSLVGDKGYTLRQGSYIWVENPLGKDWRTTFPTTAWDKAAPTKLKIATALRSETNEAVPVVDGTSSAVGKRVYLRRFVDTRTPDERRFSLILNNTSTLVRPPVRDYALQLDTTGSTINGELPLSQTMTVSATGKVPTQGAGVAMSVQVLLRRSNASVNWTAGQQYRKGETVLHDSKHFTCTKDNTDATFDVYKWDESFVHMPTDYHPEDWQATEAPILVFDNDTSGTEVSATLGYDFTTLWSTDPQIQNQYRNAADYRGVHLFLVALGLTSAQADEVLAPRPAGGRDLDPSKAADMGGHVPSLAANALDNWPVQFRRPSVIRLFGHAWEWSGYLNYTKAIPAYQGDLSPQNKFTSYFTNVNGGRVYATGFNEEGYQVTPRGLEDITTGNTLTVDNLGSNDLALETPTAFSNLTLSGTTTINDTLVINATNAAFPDVLGATVDKAGVGEIASISELETTSLAATDGGLTAAGNKFVTVAGLKYWASYAKVLTQRPGTTVFYVVPHNAVIGGSYNFNGTTAVLSADPGRTGNEINANPPTSRETAVRLDVAVAYGNANFSTLETVTYVLANGPYTSGATFNTIANVVGAVYQFPETNQLADFNGTGIRPTTDVKALYDGTYSMPCFATTMNSSTAPVPRLVGFVAYPAALKFNCGGSVNGVAWLGLGKTLASSKTDFPDYLFGNMAAYRTAGVTLQNFVDNFLAGDATLFAGWKAWRFYSLPTISCEANHLAVTNCIFGPKAPGLGAIGDGGLAPIIRPAGDCAIALNGVYLLGNTLLSDLPKARAKGLLLQDAIFGCQNSQNFISGRVEEGLGHRISVTFPGLSSINPAGDQVERDLDYNCVHILDDFGNYALMANAAATDGTRGATFDALIGEMNAGSRIYTGGYPSYWRGYTVVGRYHGFAGVFGNWRTGTQGPVGVSGGLDPMSFYRFSSYHGSLWQQARTGATLTTNKTLTPAPGTDVAAYALSSENVLNIQSKVFFQGIDVNTGQLVGGALEAGKMYG